MHAQLACVSIVTEVAHRVQLMGKTVVVKGRDGWPFSAHAEPGPSGIVFRDEAGRDVMNIADDGGDDRGRQRRRRPRGTAFRRVSGHRGGRSRWPAPGRWRLHAGRTPSIVGGSRGSRFIYRFDHRGRYRAASRAP